MRVTHVTVSVIQRSNKTFTYVTRSMIRHAVNVTNFKLEHYIRHTVSDTVAKMRELLIKVSHLDVKLTALSI